MAKTSRRTRRAAAPPKTRAAAARKQSVAERVLRFVFRALFRTIWWVTLRTSIVLALLLSVGIGYYIVQLPPAEAMMDGRDRGSVTLLDRHGDVFAVRGQLYGSLAADEAAPVLRDAVIATEDRRFMRHFGIDLRGLARAMVANVRAGRVVQGGSTITQQAAKLIFFSNERTLTRKILEIPAAIAMEIRYSKAEILTIYLNRAYLGAGTHGFEAAAQRYFGRSAAEVDLPQAAMLAGLLKAPSTYAPTSNLSGAQGRAATIIGLMADQGRITPEAAAAARAAPARLNPRAPGQRGGAFADWIMEELPDFLSGETTEDVVIETTYDPAVQEAAETALSDVFETRVREGSRAESAIVVMEPSGEVRAMVGGRRDAAGLFNRATQAQRQTGSAFKPFVYGAALAAGVDPNEIRFDEPLTIYVPGSGNWSPRNYGGDYDGAVTLNYALQHSINTVAVQLSEQAGRRAVRAVAEGFGLSGDLADGPAIALGVSEATLLEMTAAYAGIRAEGVSVAPIGMLSVRLAGDDAPLMPYSPAPGLRVLPQRAAQQLVWMMHQVVEGGTGQRARLPGWQVAGKTGTTQAARDAWFIGFTGAYVAGVWMGYDDNSPLTGVTGGGLPATIWTEAMAQVHAPLAPIPLPMIAPDPSRAPVGRTPQPELAPDPGGGVEIPPLSGPADPVQPQTQPRAEGDDIAQTVLEDVLRILREP